MSPLNWFEPSLVCRPALAGDTPAVMDLARHIWNGNDYLPYVWRDWLKDAANHLYVGLWRKELAGTINLKQLGPGQWFLEALRVHPKFQGRKFSNHLFEYALQDWHTQEPGELRLLTSSQRKVVHHLCDRMGFVRIAEIRHYQGAALHGERDTFRPLHPGETDLALSSLESNPLWPHALNLLDLGWEFCRPDRDLVSYAIQAGQAFTWREGRGNITMFFDEDDGLKHPYLSSVTCLPVELPELLLDCRRWAGRMGFSAISWNALLIQQVIDSLASAGFSAPNEADLLYLYEKKEST